MIRTIDICTAAFAAKMNSTGPEAYRCAVEGSGTG